MSIAERLARLREDLEAACRQAHRDPDEVTLVAVSKRKPTADIVAAREAGQVDFGENYAQELRDKHRELQGRDAAQGLRWHYIGPLQRNKVKYVVGNAALIHTVSSPRLLAAIERRLAGSGGGGGSAGARRDPSASSREGAGEEAEGEPKPESEAVQDVLIQVNLAEEPQKSGVAREDLTTLLDAFAEAPHVRCRGLMIIPPWDPEPEAARPLFRRLRALRDGLRDELRHRHEAARDAGRAPPPNVDLDLPELSMGMSHDFAVAIEEGATLVRVGTAIFGPRE